MRLIIRNSAAVMAGALMALALLLPIKALATSSLQSLVVSPSTVAAGQNVTVTFQYKGTNTGCKTACFATFSNQSTLRNGGTTGQVVFYDENGANCSDTQENGPGASSTVSENSTWRNSTDFTAAIYYTVPASTTPGTYYIIIAVRDCNVYMNPSCCSNIDTQAYVSFTVGSAGSATNTPKVTPTSTPTKTNSPAPTKTYTAAPTSSRTPTPAATSTTTPIATSTSTPGGSMSGNSTQTAQAVQTALAATQTALVATQTALVAATQSIQATQTQAMATATAQAHATQTTQAQATQTIQAGQTQTVVVLSYTAIPTPTFITTPLPNAWALPRVDLETSTVSQPTGMTIWSYSNTWLPIAATVVVKLPPSTTLPATLDAAGCQCLFMRITSPSGSYGGEQSVTSTVINSATNTLTFPLPEAMGKGTFYIRLDYALGMKNPAQPGPATLTLCLPDYGGKSLASKAYVITPATSGSILGAITGVVRASSTSNPMINGRPLAGAMVTAWSGGGNHWPTSWGPRAAAVDALDTTVNVYTAVTASDGSYSISLPALPVSSVPSTYSVNVIATDNYPVPGTAVNATYWGTTNTAVAVTPQATTKVDFSVAVK